MKKNIAAANRTKDDKLKIIIHTFVFVSSVKTCFSRRKPAYNVNVIEIRDNATPVLLSADSIQ